MALAKRRARGSRVTSLSSASASYPVSTLKKRYRDKDDQSSWSNQYPPHSRGVTLAQEFFELYDHGIDSDECSADDSYGRGYQNQKAEIYEEPVQLALALETEEELRRRLNHDIQRFERAYDHMALYAVRWLQLMEDVETNPQLEKMFKDMQLMRKLSGSEME